MVPLSGYVHNKILRCYCEHFKRSQLSTKILRTSQTNQCLSKMMRHSLFTSYESSRALLSNCAFIATTTVDTDIKIAPTAGESTIPAPYRTPAARGIANTL